MCGQTLRAETFLQMESNVPGAKRDAPGTLREHATVLDKTLSWLRRRLQCGSLKKQSS